MFGRKNKVSTLNFFISIGAGLNQLPLIKKAKNLGLNVIGVDNNSNAPGFVLCDLKIQESITNYNEIYLKLRELLIDGKIIGIMTRSYGYAIKTTGFLTEKFNLPFMPFKRTDDFINKKKMKALFIKHNIKSPLTYHFKKKSGIKNINKDIFPLIRKPSVGHGKIGVALINDFETLKKNLNADGSSAIYEQFIKGSEIIAVGIINRGEYFPVDITDKITTPLPFFVDIYHISPSRYYGHYNEIKKIGQSIADTFQIETSPLIMEFVIDREDNLFLIEAVPEFGGEFLSDVLIPARTGYDIISEAVKAMTGMGFKAPSQKKTKNSVVVKYVTGEKGTLMSCNPDGPKRYRGTIYSRIFKNIGSEVKEPENNFDRIGIVVVKGKTTEEALEKADTAADSFDLKIKKRK